MKYTGMNPSQRVKRNRRKRDIENRLFYGVKETSKDFGESKKRVKSKK